MFAERIGSLFALSAASILALILSGCAQQPVAQQPQPPAAPAMQPPPAAPPPASAQQQKEEQPSVSFERGRVSIYGAEFAGKKTASGERFDPEALTMAHPTLPFGTLVRVTNVENGRSVEVRVNDRGPAAAGRIADLSLAAGRKIDMLKSGVVDATLELVEQPPH